MLNNPLKNGIKLQIIATLETSASFAWTVNVTVSRTI